jgi:sulfur carrier protein
MRFFVFMRLKINGEVVDSIRASTVQELLEEMKIPDGRVAVEVNLSVVRKVDFGHFRLKEEDTVEIVNFVGGG